MKRIPRFIPVTDLRQDAAAVLRAIQSGDEPIVIMQRSRSAAVLISVDAYERMVYEREVLGLMAEGRSNGAIAEQLVVTERAVEKHVTSIFGKLGLTASNEDHRRVLAVLRFLES